MTNATKYCGDGIYWWYSKSLLGVANVFLRVSETAG